MKKAGQSTAKSGSGHIGKSGSKLKPGGSMGSGTKIGSSSGNIGTSSTKIGGKLGSSPKTSTFQPTSQKSYAPPSFTPSKAGKSSTSFGIIWLPMKKRNKYKDASFNSNKNERSPEKRPTMYGFMPGESNHAPYLDHKKEETSLIVPESKASTSVAVIGAGAATATELSSDKTRTEEKQDLIKHEEESKDAAGDHDKTDDYLDNDKVIVNAPKHTNEKPGDNVDSVFLRPPPPHKRRPSPPANEEEEDCGIKCLYYTLQCCDCVLM
ncbi:uncharacterized protein LOC121739507 isoform X2 [Aricia agestis]|nr:uncharacterized protein LOC121739507 isoform X2 [Aricia agestis]XP_041987941.1 uncharacterized protein LOC121739507 isoform X2 [Aricia agestis]